MSQSNPTDVEATKYSEAFILYGDKTRAFRVAFPNSKAKPESQHVNAVQLHDTAKVQLRIEEIRGGIESEAKNDALYTVEQKKLLLIDIAQYGIGEEIIYVRGSEEEEPEHRQRNPSAAVSAVKELNLMDGDHAPTKNLNKNLGATDSFELFKERAKQ